MRVQNFNPLSTRSEPPVPELPEVETMARELSQDLPGRTVLTATLRPKSLYRRGSASVHRLVGRTICAVERVGKNTVIRFRPSGLMLVNLGMTGRLVTAPNGSYPAGSRASHLHGRFKLDGDLRLLYYDARRFGHFYVAETCDFQKDLNIGPDPFIAKPGYFKHVLEGRTAPIKSLLLDQRLVSGIGNIYADELLFDAGVDPRTPAGQLSDSASRLLRSARTVLKLAIDYGGSTIRDYRRRDGSTGEFQQHHAVYGREGEPCKVCGTSIARVTLGGRGTHFCPGCQR